MPAVPRMRTVKQCVDYFKEQDPECCIGEWYVRRLIKQNKIPTRRSGRRILINLDTLIDYLAKGEEPENKEELHIE